MHGGGRSARRRTGGGGIAGESIGLAGIYDRYADPLYDTAYMLHDRDEAADVVQDVFVKAAEKQAMRDRTS